MDKHAQQNRVFSIHFVTFISNHVNIGKVIVVVSSLVFILLSLCFSFVSLEGSGNTGSISNSSIRTHAVTRRMGPDFLFFTWWLWGREKHAIGNGSFVVKSSLRQFKVAECQFLSGGQAPIIVGSRCVCLCSAHRMVGCWDEYLDALKMASSWTVTCWFWREQGLLAELSEVIYGVI